VRAETKQVQQTEASDGRQGWQAFLLAEEAAASSKKRRPDERTDGEGPSVQCRKNGQDVDSESSPAGQTAVPFLLLAAATNLRRACVHQWRWSRCKYCGGSRICGSSGSGPSVKTAQRKNSPNSSICGTLERLRSRCQDCGGSDIFKHQQVREPV